jgi:MFS family permease
VRELYAISFSAFTVMVGVGVIAPLLPIFAESLGATGLWIGVIFSAYSFSRLIFLPIAGKLSDRYGRKRIVVSGLILYSFISLLYIISNTPEELSAVRFLHGISSAMIIPVAMAAAAEFSPRGEEGYIIGVFNRSLFLGMASGPFIGGFVSDFIGYRYTFLVISLIGLVTLLFVFFTFPEIEVKRKELKISKINTRVRGAFLFRFINSMGRGSILSFLPIYLGLIGYSAGVIGILISLNLFVSAIIQPSSGKLSDRIGTVYPVTLSAIFSAVLLFIIPRISEISILLILSVFLGVSSALAIPAIGAIVAVEGRDGGMGQLIGTLSASKSLGRIIGPLVSGAIYDLFGGGVPGIQMAFNFAAFLSILSILLFLLSNRSNISTKRLSS